ncbi:lipopolysaccharide biosynthesis protein [Bacteroides bouchesdurhonensis]|uniref:lipopolysaccharide biosynthesis protein n=1 Tax=Bacteroides bouchesdurhonensis TaxID=1841855 RepID=UPI00135651CD|nr:oligosaccharide flippase family protein [Bacteroides bouchesdurhonensis]
MSIPQKAALWYMICNVLQKGINFLVIPIYVRLLTTSEYGHFTMFQSWSSVLVIFATLNLYCGVFTKAMVDYSEDRDRYTSSMQGLSLIVTIIFFGLYVISPSYWSKILDIDKITILLLFLYFVTYPSVSFWCVRQRVENHYKQMALLTIIMSIMTPILSIILLLGTNLRVNAIIWGTLLIQIVFGSYFFLIQFYRGKCFLYKKYWVHALKFNIPLIPHYLSLVVLGQVDRLLIGKICGEDKAGIYGLASQVSLAASVIISAINGSYVPWTYEKFKIKNYDEVRAQSNKLCILAGLLSLGVMLLGPDIILIMGTDEYMDAIWIVPPIALSIYFTFCYSLFSMVEFYYNATKYVMISTSVGAICSICLNILLLPKFGYISAGYTSLTCYTIFLVMHYIFMCKVIRRNIGNVSIYNMVFMSKSWIILIGFMLLSLLIYTMPLIRYLLLLLLLLLAYRKRYLILNYIKFKSND